jgi:hypothetical protein
MSNQDRSVGAEAGARPQGVERDGRAGGPWAGRLVSIILALYLTPALLAVLLVGGVGLLVLAVARAITAIVHGREAWPRSPVGPESPAS